MPSFMLLLHRPVERRPMTDPQAVAAVTREYMDWADRTRAAGPGAGLAQLDELAGNARLSRYSHYHAARGDLLLKLGRQTEAGAALRQALECPLNGAERDYLLRKLRTCSTPARQAHS